jgi:glycine/D-amino acid oxidase-like deaminating enzyme
MPAVNETYRGLSLWHETAGDSWTPRAPQPGDVEADVAIVGAGFTGLWTAYWLTEQDPSLDIVLVESEVAGFGASGRNGGWCSAIFPASLRRIAKDSGREGAVRMQRAMNETVALVGATAAKEGVDCDFELGGYLSLARNHAQLRRSATEVETWRGWGFGDDHIRLLDQDEAAELAQVHGALGGTFTPHCAALHPAKLVRGLARVVESRGVRIFEQTAALAVTPRKVTTTRGAVRARFVVRATEGYTPRVPGHHRDIVPMYSLMVATEPLPESVWAEIGLTGRPTFSDKRHLRIYGQRTADGRLAFGGRGAPYHFGSRIDPSFDQDRRVHGMLTSILRDLFPVLATTRFTHAWGGNLGIPRDWYPSVALDRATGLASAGGYVGDGVATAVLAGRTLADLICGRETDLTTLPWVGRASPRWEPEPLRWLGVNAVTAIFAGADITERRLGRPSRAASGVWRVLGH